MELNLKKRLVIIITAGFILAGASYMLAAPGGEDDPIITLSYIKQVLIPSITDQIKEICAPEFKVVDIEAGKNVICGAGTELILRKGSAKIIATQKGGIANVTAGVDLPHDAEVPANSLLIVPLPDGRGIAAVDDVIVMIKGEYTIQQP